MGSVDYPFDPLSLALGADATFVARPLDTDKPGLTNVLRRAAQHQGTSFVEIFSASAAPYLGCVLLVGA